MTLLAAPYLSNCQNQNPKGIHRCLDLLNILTRTAFFADLICTPFGNVHQLDTDSNEALAVWYKLFMDVVNMHAPVRHKRVKQSKLPPWLNKNIIQAMSDRDRLKKERMFTKYKTACNKVNILVRNIYIRKLVENNKDISSVWRALNTFTKKEPTLDRKKFRIISQLMHLMTTLCPLQKPSLNHKTHLIAISTIPAQNALLIYVSKRQREPIRSPYP